MSTDDLDLDTRNLHRALKQLAQHFWDTKPDLANDLEHLAREAERTKSEDMRWQEVVEDMEQDYEDLQAEHREVLEDRAALQRENEELEQEVLYAHNETEDAREEVETAMQDEAGYIERIKTLEAEIRDLQDTGYDQRRGW